MRVAWYLPPMLAAIARYGQPGQKIDFRASSLWADNPYAAMDDGIAQMALSAMQRHGYVRPLKQSGKPKTRMGKTDTTAWALTALGWQAAQAAWRSMPGGPLPDMRALDVRLWNLLRIRRRLTADEAAQTLIDAAAPDWHLEKQRIAARLAAWAKHAPKAVCRGAKREAGQVRFVLCEGGDLGRWPPPARAGELHPSEFARTQAIPERYLKSVPTVTAPAADGQEVHP